MVINGHLSYNEELFATRNDLYWPPFEALAEIGPRGGLGARGADPQLLEPLSSGSYSHHPWAAPHVAPAPLIDPEPAIPQLTVSLSELVLPPEVYQYECTTRSYPPLLFTFPDEGRDSDSGVHSTKPTTSRHVSHALPSRKVVDQSEPKRLMINGHPVLRYVGGSCRYRCLSIVTANGKVSHLTRKRQDEIVRHLKTSQWHKKLGEEHTPLACDICGKQLSRRDALARHMRAVHLEPKMGRKSTVAHSKRRTKKTSLVSHEALQS